MKRILIRILAVVIALAGAAGAAAHFVGKPYVKDQITIAIERLRQAGVEVTYDSIEVNGAVVPETAVITDVDVYIPELRVRFALPAAASDLSIFEADTFAFALPPELVLELTDRRGDPTGRQILVSARDFKAVLRATEPNVYDFGAIASEARLRPARDGAALDDAQAVFKDLDAHGQVVVDPSARSVSAAFRIAFANLAVSPSDAGAVNGVANGEINAAIAPSGAELSVALGALRVNPRIARCGEIAEAVVRDVRASFGVSAAGALDLGRLLDLEHIGDAPQALLTIGRESVLAGGRVDVAAGVGELCVSEVPRDVDRGSFTIEAADVGAAIVFAPQLGRVKVDAARAKVTTIGAFYSYADAYGHTNYDHYANDIVIDNNAFHFELTIAPASDGFDFALLERPDAFVANVVSNFDRGGSTQLTLRNGATRFERSNRGDQNRLAITNDALSLSIALDRQRVALDFVNEGLAAQWTADDALAGGSIGRIALSPIALPLAASDAPQIVPMGFELSDVTLHDAVWAQLDPSGALDRAIGGLDIALEVGFVVGSDVVRDPQRFLRGLRLSSIEIKRVAMSMLGAALSAEGRLDVDATQRPDDLDDDFKALEGAVQIRLTGWRAPLETLIAAPPFAQPEAARALTELGRFIETYGAPTDAGDSVLFDVTLDDRTLQIGDQQIN